MNTHNVSATISIKDDEWDDVAEWMWFNRHYYNGLAVLPYDGGTYKQAPFETITKEQYEEMYGLLEDIDLTKVIESEDNTDLSGELACAGGLCEIWGIGMPSSYYDLSYNERMEILNTLFNTFNKNEQNRLLLAFEVCKELEDETDKNFR